MTLTAVRVEGDERRPTLVPASSRTTHASSSELQPVSAGRIVTHRHHQQQFDVQERAVVERLRHDRARALRVGGVVVGKARSGDEHFSSRFEEVRQANVFRQVF